MKASPNLKIKFEKTLLKGKLMFEKNFGKNAKKALPRFLKHQR